MKKMLFFIVLIVAYSSAFADGYWLELKGNHKVNDTLFIFIRYGGVEQQQRYIKKDHDLDKMKDFALYVIGKDGKKNKISINQYAEYWMGFYVPKQKGSYRIIAIDSTLPVVERADSLQNIKPVQYLCSTYKVESNEAWKQALQKLDIQVTIKDSIATIYSFIDGKKIALSTKLRVFFPDGHDEQIVVLKDGTATLKLAGKGLYLIRLDLSEPVKNVYEGKKYYAVRHRCDYSLLIE